MQNRVRIMKHKYGLTSFFLKKSNKIWLICLHDIVIFLIPPIRWHIFISTHFLGLMFYSLINRLVFIFTHSLPSFDPNSLSFYRSKFILNMSKSILDPFKSVQRSKIVMNLAMCRRARHKFDVKLASTYQIRGCQQ